VCHNGTVRVPVSLLTLVLVGAALVSAQSPDWRKVGGTAVEEMLAGPATGPVDEVWFSADGGALFARTHSGRVFQTVDFESWTPAVNAPDPVHLTQVTPVRMPEAGARVVSGPATNARLYALGKQLFRSGDDGASWETLTALKTLSVIGPGQRSLAISPSNTDQLVVANAYGVWRTNDAGLSWHGLNEFLPNLSIRRILATPSGASGAQVEADGIGTLELSPGTTVWQPYRSAVLENEAARTRQYSEMLGAEITAVGAAGEWVVAGSANGRLWISIDRGKLFHPTQTPSGVGGRVEAIFVESTPQGNVALAALSGKGPHVLRATNENFWDVLDGNLPDASVHGVTGDRASGAVYVATDKGIFWTTTDLETASANPVNWSSLSDRLPAAAATDVRLDPARITLYATVDGYGMYAAAAPHRRNNLRVVNTADFSTRPAAPGSLLSVVGGRVDSARGGSLNYPVLAVVGNESQIQVPFEAVGPNVALALQVAGNTVNRNIAVQPVSPAILVGRDAAPMLWDGETGLAIDLKNPAHPNGRVQIWATGLGKVKPDWPTGMPAQLDNPPQVVAAVRAYLDGVEVPVARATLLPGFVGSYLVEVQLPGLTNAGTAELYITAGGHESNRVILIVEP
jgi:uncharacterized protein (TIGR03437 family)